MGVQIHIAPHPEQLVAQLCDQVAAAQRDPFAVEMVAVPSRGIERWLTQRIASGMAERGAGDGICANVVFPSPDEVVFRGLAAVPDLAASAAAWEGPALTASLLETIDAELSEPWMSLLARYVSDGHAANRMTAAAKMARLFTRYARRRPDMIRAWRDGRDEGADGQQLSDDFAWQPQMWRAVRRRIAIPSLPELLPEGLGPLRNGTATTDLPERVAVYGLTSANPLDLAVVTALGDGGHDVHLYVLHPSPALWEATAHTSVTALPSRREDSTRQLVRHPLLATWGRDSRELATVLAAAGLRTRPEELQTPDEGNLLSHLQDDIRRNRPPRFDPQLSQRVISGVDRSVQFHVCHGSRRQAEVLRDAILHLLRERPDLEPRDVVVMTPDLTTYAPLLEAAFPGPDAEGLPDLRLRVADRSPAATNPLVAFTARLLEVIGSRLEADVIRELVGRPVVQNRFGFDADTAGAIVTLIDDANVSWGLDADHRRDWGLGSVEQRTWQRALDRTLAGVFYSDSPVRTVGDIAPLHGVEGQEAMPAGILAAIIDRIAAVRDLLSPPRPFSQWAEAVTASVRMLAAPSWDDEWQIDQLERLLSRTFPPPRQGQADPEITVGEALGAISSWTDDRPSPLHFRTGDMTLCTLVPMRSVPYRVVALLGMDEARFPRRGRFDGDDLLTDHEMVGDRDAGSMDRQLLLDAVMAAGEHLIVTFAGRDHVTNAAMPPSVPIAELSDTLETMVGSEGAPSLHVHHPLQAFSEANFIPDELRKGSPWSFDLGNLRAARAAQRRPRFPAPRPLEWPPLTEEDPIRLTHLIEFLESPVRRFVKARLGFAVPAPGGIPDDAIPSDLDALTQWSMTDRLLSGLISGHEPEALVRRELGSDVLPPGDLAGDDMQRALETASVLWQAAQEHGYDPRRHQPYAGTVDTGVGVVEGTVSADPESGHIARVTPSRLRGKHRLDSFTRMVFLTALRPDIAWKALLLGRREQGESHVAVTIGPVKGDEPTRRTEAVGLLGELVSLYHEGRQSPLPLPCETAYRWQRRGGTEGDRSRAEAAAAFEGEFGEGADPAHRLVLAEVGTFTDLEKTGFTDFCSRLWLPILAISKERNL